MLQAWLLSRAIADAFAGRTLDWPPLLLGLAGVLGGRAALAHLNAVAAQRAAAAVKSQLRRDVLAARLRRPAQAPVSTPTLIRTLTEGLDALDGYFSRYLPQLALAVTVPLIVGVAILSTDLTSTIIIAVTVPLIPIFMVLIGRVTQARVRKRWTRQARLAGHFADLVDGLATLQVFGRARAQLRGLRAIEADNRRETMGTLRIAFLSALVLELLASLSVAVVAVGIGLRVVYGHLDLQTALFVLMLAPEVYLPIRQVGVHFHDSADGVAAVEDAFAVIDAGADAPPAVLDDGLLLRMRGVEVRYPGAEAAALEAFDLDLAPGELTVLAGPSGGGKSTALAVAMGFVRPGAGELRVAQAWEAWRSRVAWVGQVPGLVPGSIDDNVALGAPGCSPEQRRRALDAVGGAELALERPVGDDGEGLSGGERRRVGLARAWLRLAHGGADVLIMDEPTAGLDAAQEQALIEALRRLGHTALVVSHRPAVIAAADRVVEVGRVPEVGRR